jgi:hypothetical protein
VKIRGGGARLVAKHSHDPMGIAPCKLYLELSFQMDDSNSNKMKRLPKVLWCVWVLNFEK